MLCKFVAGEPKKCSVEFGASWTREVWYSRFEFDISFSAQHSHQNDISSLCFRRPNICTKRGVPHCMLISWLTHQEVEVFVRTPGDVCYHICCNKTGCFFRRPVDMSSRFSLTKPTKTKMPFFMGNQIVSICNHGDQNRYFKPNHNVFVTLTEVVFMSKLKQRVNNIVTRETKKNSA